MTTGFIWNYKLPSEKFATHDEYEELINSIEFFINQADGKFIYTHKVLLICMLPITIIFSSIDID